MKLIKYAFLLVAACIAKTAIADPQCQLKADTSGNQTVPEAALINGVRVPTVVTLDASNSSVTTGGMTFRWFQDKNDTVKVQLSDATAAKPTFTAPDVGPGGATLHFNVEVTGCSGATKGANSNVNITNSNAAPTASFTAPSTVKEGDAFTLDASASSDPDGDALTYSWVQTDGPSVSGLTNTKTVTLVAPRVPYPNGASLTFKLTVSDGILSGETSRTVNVQWVDEAPVAKVQCDSTVKEGASYLLDGSSSTDNDDGIASYAWTQQDGGPNAGLTGATAQLPSFSLTAPSLTSSYDTMTFRLVVTDKTGLYASAECAVKVLDVTPPVITAADVKAEATSAAGAVVTFSPAAHDAVEGDEPVTCSSTSGLRSGDTFPLGSTTVECSASDSKSNKANATFTVTVVDTTPPKLTLPADITSEATGPGGATVTYDAAASDLVDGSVTPVCTPASGATFALGSTTVNCTATDKSGNSADGSFAVVVRDTTPPSLKVPADMVAEATGPGGANVTFEASATDLVDGSVTPVCAPASGSTFALDVSTVVKCIATDKHGNSANASFTVTVKDSTAPALIVPADITAEATGPSGAIVTYNASAMDLVDGAVTPDCYPVSGSGFSLDVPTLVTCTAADKHKNSVSRSFTVTVEDRTPPTLTIPANITAEATGPAGAAVSFAVTATDLVDSTPLPECVPASGSVFPLGTTNVSCTATDAHHNTSAAQTFAVTVQDTTPPKLTLPSSFTAWITSDATSSASGVVTYAVSASDLVDGSITPVCSPASGSVFRLGVTTVNCSATDFHGNSSTGSFDIMVNVWSNFLPPINVGAQPRSVFKGKTIPVKFQAFNASGQSIATLRAVISVYRSVSSGAAGTELEVASTAAADTGNLFRYDPVAQQYIFNLSTSGMLANTDYQISVDLGDGVLRSVVVKYGGR